MVETWQVGIVTFLICSIIFIPFGIIAILFLYVRRNKKVNINNHYTEHIEDCRNAYKKDWDELV